MRPSARAQRSCCHLLPAATVVRRCLVAVPAAGRQPGGSPSGNAKSSPRQKEKKTNRSSSSSSSSKPKGNPGSSAAAPQPSGFVVRLELRVKPSAMQSKIVSFAGDAIELQIAAPPANNEANREVVEYLARAFGVPRADVVLVSGAKSRDKCVELTLAAAASSNCGKDAVPDDDDGTALIKALIIPALERESA